MLFRLQLYSRRPVSVRHIELNAQVGAPARAFDRLATRPRAGGADIPNRTRNRTKEVISTVHAPLGLYPDIE